MVAIFPSSFLCVWSRLPFKNPCCLEIFCLFFDHSTNCRNLWSCGTIAHKAVIIFLKNFFDFRLDKIEKNGILNLVSNCSKTFVSVILRYSDKEKDVAFAHFSTVFCKHVALHTRRSISSDFSSSIFNEYFVKFCSFSAFIVLNLVVIQSFSLF